ncbi:MAG: phosphate-starvation-inducible PsiE family protein [Proteobacteria bacterium]|nr:phosphate-starvation-inducible PsiE family protein [Pseudomonadota bacterium]MDE3207287.1 phosphate-starvation-inducible PsiE family protein [Pseudomonadota bacterium]
MKAIIQRAYDLTIDVIVSGLILMMLITLVFAFIGVFTSLIHLVPTLPNLTLDDAELRDLVISVLGVFVIIELFSIFINYVKTRHIRLSILIDVTAVFILRDMLIKLYSKVVSNEELLVLALLLVVMVIARSITTRYSPTNSSN